MTTTPIVVNSITDLQAIQNDPSGHYVLGADIDAAGLLNFGIANFSGVLDGQGHSIDNLQNPSFGMIDTQGVVENLNLTNVHLYGAALALDNEGTILACSVTGAILGRDALTSGIAGLVSFNGGTGVISNSYSTCSVTNNFDAGGVGGLVDTNVGLITGSYATGALSGYGRVGGLVEDNGAEPNGEIGTISNSYATGSITGEIVGGLVAVNDANIIDSYATGFMIVRDNFFPPGGLVGFSHQGQQGQLGNVTSSYWDIETTGTTYSAGGTGLTTAQLESGVLPVGFDPAIWLETAGQFPELRWRMATTPIVINTIIDLKAIQNNPSGSYVLGANIDAAGFNFASIADFSGVLDGQGYSIDNLQGPLFNKIDVQGVVQNLNLTNVHLYDAALAIDNEGTILACSVSGAILGHGNTGDAAGMVIVNGSSGVISNSYTTCSVNGNFNSPVVAGLVAENYGVITGSYTTGAVDGSNGAAGGLVGSDHGGTVSNSYATGSVTGNAPGGLMGSLFGGSMDSYATGLITLKTGSGFLPGGLVGVSFGGTVSDSYWDIETTGTSYSNGGGTVLIVLSQKIFVDSRRESAIYRDSPANGGLR